MKIKKWVCAILILQCLLLMLLYWCVDTLTTDSRAPKIQIEPGMLQLSVTDPESALLQGVTATDNTDGDVTDSLVVERVTLKDSDGTVTVCYAAFDAAGNVAKAERELRYTDYHSPRFTLSEPLILDSGYYADLRAVLRAEDAVDGDISHRIHMDNLTGSSATVVGTFQVRLWVTNSLGDRAQLDLPVEVCASGTYNAWLELTDYLIYLPVGAEFDPANWLLRCSAGGVTEDLTDELPENCDLQITGQVDSQTPGVYEVRYLLSWNRDGRKLTGYTKLMVVVEG